MRRLSRLLPAAVLLIAPLSPSFANLPVPIPGSKLKLGTRFGAHLIVESRGTINTDNTDGTSADPVLHGASIRMYSTAGDTFDHTYPLPASAQWRYHSLPGLNRGYTYKDAAHANGPIRVVRIGKLFRATGTGVDFSINSNPNPVNIVVAVGDQKYCMSFGGQSEKFIPGTRYLSLHAPAPASCPLSPSGAFLDDAGL